MGRRGGLSISAKSALPKQGQVLTSFHFARNRDSVKLSQILSIYCQDA